MHKLDDIDDLLNELALMQDRLLQTPDDVTVEPNLFEDDVPQTLLQSTLSSYFDANTASTLLTLAPVKRILKFDTDYIGHAVAALETSEKLYRRAGDTRGLGITIGLLSHAHMALGKVPEAMSCLAISMGHFVMAHDYNNASRCGVNLGVAKAALADYHRLLSALADAAALIPFAERMNKKGNHERDVVASYERLEEADESLRRYAFALLHFSR